MMFVKWWSLHFSACMNMQSNWSMTAILLHALKYSNKQRPYIIHSFLPEKTSGFQIRIMEWWHVFKMREPLEPAWNYLFSFKLPYMLLTEFFPLLSRSWHPLCKWKRSWLVFWLKFPKHKFQFEGSYALQQLFVSAHTSLSVPVGE